MKGNQEPMLYTTNAAVASLNHVSGFDPLKFLRRTTSRKTGEDVMRLDLRYKKLWFRLACPTGRLKLNALRITEKMAIFEAKVYRDREDAELLSSYVANCTLDATPGGLYVEAAQEEALDKAVVPMKQFMLKQTEVSALNLFTDAADSEQVDNPEELSLVVIVPAFVTSELKRAFTAGLLLYIPFLLIDIVVSSTLMSMGMIMLPPATIALPFKLLLFVTVNGWELLFASIINGF